MRILISAFIATMLLTLPAEANRQVVRKSVVIQAGTSTEEAHIAGNAAYEAKNFLKAEPLLLLALQGDGLSDLERARVNVKLGRIQLRQFKNFELAEIYLNQSTKDLPDGEKFANLYFLSVARFMQGDAFGSLQASSNAHDLLQSKFTAAQIGLARFARGEMKKAASAFEFSIEKGEKAPFFVLMQYLAEAHYFGVENARWFLFIERSNIDDGLYQDLAQLLIDEMTVAEVFDGLTRRGEASDPQILTDFYFFVGAYYELLGDNYRAVEYMRASVGQYFWDNDTHILARFSERRIAGDSWLLGYANLTKQRVISPKEQLAIDALEAEDSMLSRRLLADIRFEMALGSSQTYLKARQTLSRDDNQIAGDALALALLLARSAVDLNPREGRYWRLLGDIAFRIRDNVRYRVMAIDALKMTRELDSGDDASTVAHLARLHFEARFLRQSVDYYSVLVLDYPQVAASTYLELVNSACIEAHLHSHCSNVYEIARKTTSGETYVRLTLGQASLLSFQGEKARALALAKIVVEKSEDRQFSLLARKLQEALAK